MNSRVTMGLALLFLFGAVFAGYWGLVLSRPPVPPPQAPVEQASNPVAVPVEKPIEDPTRQPVVVLIRDVPAYDPIKADDLIIEKLKVAPPGAFSKVEEAIGRLSWRPLVAGSWLTESSFDAGGTLARMIRPGERAMALSVDEISGAGGQLSPGDYVDVLLYLPPEQVADQSIPDRTAQTVMPALRVLSVGELLGPVIDGQEDLGVSREERLAQQKHKAGARSIVVAVPEQLLSRLLLASQSGTVRLAVRSAQEQNLQHYWAGENDVAARLDVASRNVAHFNQLSTAGPVSKPTGSAQPRSAKGVEIIRGNQITQQTP
jgi:pilus assembly protein CpaB